jgi:hypothetical protein
LKNIPLASSPPALMPANALPWALGLCSLSWKPEALALGAREPATRQATREARGENLERGNMRLCSFF